MLHDSTKDVDFGYFCGPKGTAYFKVTDDDYTFDNVMCSQAYGGIHVFVYRTERYALLKRYEKVATGNGAIDACVVSNKLTGACYALVMPTGTQFNAGKLAYQTPVKTVYDTCIADYPAAKVFVGTTKAWGSDYAALSTYLTSDTYMGLGETRVYAEDGTALAGGIYYAKDPTLTASVTNVTVSGISEPAVVATLTYASGCTVVFKDWDGSVIDTVRIVSGGTATPPDNPAREGYDFTGWSGSYENVTADCEVTATYEIQTFDVTFKDADGTVLKLEEDVPWGTAATAPEVSAPEGFVFQGWEPSEFSSVKSNMTITATYVERSNLFTVRFLDSDGTVLKTEQVVREESATAPADPAPKTAGTLFYGWSPADFSSITSDLDVTAVYGPSVLEVSDSEGLVTALAALPAPATVRLMANLDFEGTDYTAPVLTGTLDGNGHAITNLTTALFSKVTGGAVRNLTLQAPSRAFTAYNLKGGFIADRLEGATIENVTIENGTFTSKNSGNGLATIAYWVTTNSAGTATVISNCVARNCMLTGLSNSVLGGLVGDAYAGTEITDCQFRVDDPSVVSLGNTPESAGGIVGSSHGAVLTRCYAEGFYRAFNGAQTAGVGGLVGSVFGTTKLVACTNAASVLYAGANGGAGGLVGRDVKSTCRIDGCLNLGSVTVSNDVDSASTRACGAGGLIGGAWGEAPIHINASRNAGTVTSWDARPAGGLVGHVDGTDSGIAHLFVSNSVNVASVSSECHAGGLVGRINKSTEDMALINFGNLGNVHSATGYVGGIVGVFAGMGQNNDKNFTVANIDNLMNCGRVTTGSGTRGALVGLVKGSDRNSYSLSVSHAYLLAEEGIEFVGAVEGKEGTGAVRDETSPTGLKVVAFKNHSVVKALNQSAEASGWVLWVQTKAGPDLSLFADDYSAGMVIIIR